MWGWSTILASFGDGHAFYVTELNNNESGFPTNSSEITGKLIKRSGVDMVNQKLITE